MITTRESINYQFSLIFGYSSPNDLIAGDIIGPGKLTKERVKALSIDVLKFFRSYNAMLRDYTGSEVFSIEFSLHNIDEKDAQMKIYPKSMIFIPGKYKECESLLLALKPETGVLNTHRSREELIKISNLFYEVEEFINRPDLERQEKEQIINEFAARFSMKLYGKLIEDKWNKKLIGLSTSLPTEKELLDPFASIKSKMEIIWYNRPYEMIITDSKFEKIKTPFKEQTAIDHLKFSISAPSANFVIEKTFKLGTNLIDLANTGTIDESQEEIISYLISYMEDKISNVKEKWSVKSLISEIEKILGDLESSFNKFFGYSNDFLATGEIGTLIELLGKYKQFILEKGKLENKNFEDFCNLAINSIKQSIIKIENLRVIELKSVIYYFSERFKNSILLIKEALPKYLSRRMLKTSTIEFIKKIKENLQEEEKPVKILSDRYLEKFYSYLLNQIEINPLISKKVFKFNEEKLIKEFSDLIKRSYQNFFDTIDLKITDLVSFAEVLMEKDRKVIRSHIEKFKKYSAELHFLLSYILRYTTINRYLKEESDEEISDPVTFANRFHRFLEKRMGGIDLEWKSYILEWITDYAKIFFKTEEQKDWNLKEIYNNFISYLENKESSQQELEKFLELLDSYIAKIPNEIEKSYLLEFFRQFDFCIKNKLEFPKYLKNKIEDKIKSLDPKLEELIPVKFFYIENDSFFKYLRERELKYLSKLIPQPTTLILKHNLTNEEKELFNADFFHVFNFRFWGKNNVSIEIADNFKEVHREWVKEL
ncbi:MAG: hypothetical protein EU540_07055 [Promethearchaeota archaeon]|nr:MAG: hypothetical protein EU540_07055 [Candidatus Lokiarchaeota archaeon]